jgi:type IV pilus assembly protein PilV
MNTPAAIRNNRTAAGSFRQRGSFMLEALVGIAILSFGILGIIGLQAQSIRWVNDAQYRSEAVYYANSVISRMWADDPATLAAKYGTTSGAGYKSFRETVKTLPYASDDAYAPEITVEDGPALRSSLVTVTVRWRLPGETKGSQYITSAVIGSNE